MPTHIGIVDEDPQRVAAIANAFGAAGYVPEGASSFVDALRLIRDRAQSVLIVSMELGEFNGLHLLVRSAVEHPAVRVIVVGPPIRAIADEALALGASAYVPRPVTPERLVDRVGVLSDVGDLPVLLER